MAESTKTLLDSLEYEPVPLKFGTSGRRGRVVDLTQLEMYLNLRGELDFLRELSPSEGGISAGATIYVGSDLRPSSTSFSAQDEGRGELAQAICAAIHDAGFVPAYLGILPTPALMTYALAHGSASVMVTGSHIPFDRNGYKLNTAAGELLKSHEAPIGAHTERWRTRLYSEPAQESAFDAKGMLRGGSRQLPPVNDGALADYVERLVKVFPQSLQGWRVLFYEHSSAGRDLMPRLLEALGATVVRAGRSDVFVPIDTENLGVDQLNFIQQLHDEAYVDGAPFDAVLSCDGDSDRPLVLAVHEGKVEFISGDLLGMLAAEFLQPDAVVVPISCNPAIDESPLAAVLRSKTRIGSPFVIAGMQDAVASGARQVCGWEANGGFLLGTDLQIHGETLPALPTRDAALPMIAAMLLARRKGLSLHSTAALLPRRYGATALLKEFPRTRGLALVESYSPAVGGPATAKLDTLREIFTPTMLRALHSVDYTDGVRMYGDAGEVLHLRPSGNADEFRVYAVAATPERAAELAAAAESFLDTQRG